MTQVDQRYWKHEISIFEQFNPPLMPRLIGLESRLMKDGTRSQVNLMKSLLEVQPFVLIIRVQLCRASF